MTKTQMKIQALLNNKPVARSASSSVTVDDLRRVWADSGKNNQGLKRALGSGDDRDGGTK